MKNKLLKICSLSTLALSSTAIVTSCKDSKEYTITFDSVGGSTVSSVTTKDGIVTEPDVPTKDGYSFFGWYKDADYQYKFNFSNKINSDITLYAKWVKTAKVTKAEWEAAFDTIFVISEKHNFKLVQNFNNGYTQVVTPFWVDKNNFKCVEPLTEWYQEYVPEGGCNICTKMEGYSKSYIHSFDHVYPSNVTILDQYLHSIVYLRDAYDQAIYNEANQCYDVLKGPSNVDHIYFTQDKKIAQIEHKYYSLEFSNYGEINLSSSMPLAESIVTTHQSGNSLVSEPQSKFEMSELVFFTLDLSPFASVSSDKITFKLFGKESGESDFSQKSLTFQYCKHAFYLNGTNIVDKLIFSGETMDVTIDPSVTITAADKLVFAFSNSFEKYLSEFYLVAQISN